MYYGHYKNIRNNVWSCLIDFKAHSLPIDILGIAREAGIHVVKNSKVHDLDVDEHGKSYCNGKSWIIVYDDRDDTLTARFTLAHELGHIFLGHDLVCRSESGIKEFKKKPLSEEEADVFALRLLCPACVLNELGITSPRDITEWCRIPEHLAQIRYKRLSELQKRNKFFTSKLEVRLFENFKDFLAKAKNKN